MNSPQRDIINSTEEESTESALLGHGKKKNEIEQRKPSKTLGRQQGYSRWNAVGRDVILESACKKKKNHCNHVGLLIVVHKMFGFLSEFENNHTHI